MYEKEIYGTVSIAFFGVANINKQRKCANRPFSVCLFGANAGI